MENAVQQNSASSGVHSQSTYQLLEIAFRIKDNLSAFKHFIMDSSAIQKNIIIIIIIIIIFMK